MDAVIWIGSYKFGWVDIALIALIVYILFKLKNLKGEEISIPIIEEETILEKMQKDKTRVELDSLKDSYKKLDNMYKESIMNETIMGIVIMIQNAFIREIQNANIEMQSFSNALNKLEMMTSDADYAKEVILENKELITLYLSDDKDLCVTVGEFLEKLNEKEMGEK